MKISKVIEALTKILKKYGDIEVVGYDYSSANINLEDSAITEIQALFDENGGDYAEIGFLPKGREKKEKDELRTRYHALYWLHKKLDNGDWDVTPAVEFVARNYDSVEELKAKTIQSIQDTLFSRNEPDSDFLVDVTIAIDRVSNGEYFDSDAFEIQFQDGKVTIKEESGCE